MTVFKNMLVLNYLFELKIEGFNNLGTMEKEGGGRGRGWQKGLYIDVYTTEKLNKRYLRAFQSMNIFFLYIHI